LLSVNLDGRRPFLISGQFGGCPTSLCFSVVHHTVGAPSFYEERALGLLRLAVKQSSPLPILSTPLRKGWALVFRSPDHGIAMLTHRQGTFLLLRGLFFRTFLGVASSRPVFASALVVQALDCRRWLSRSSGHPALHQCKLPSFGACHDRKTRLRVNRFAIQAAQPSVASFESNEPAGASWAERAYSKLSHYNRLDKGGLFAAWEQPNFFHKRFARASDHCSQAWRSRPLDPAYWDFQSKRKKEKEK